MITKINAVIPIKLNGLQKIITAWKFCYSYFNGITLFRLSFNIKIIFIFIVFLIFSDIYIKIILKVKLIFIVSIYKYLL